MIKLELHFEIELKLGILLFNNILNQLSNINISTLISMKKIVKINCPRSICKLTLKKRINRVNHLFGNSHL